MTLSVNQGATTIIAQKSAPCTERGTTVTGPKLSALKTVICVVGYYFSFISNTLLSEATDILKSQENSGPFCPQKHSRDTQKSCVYSRQATEPEDSEIYPDQEFLLQWLEKANTRPQRHIWKEMPRVCNHMQIRSNYTIPSRKTKPVSGSSLRILDIRDVI